MIRTNSLTSLCSLHSLCVLLRQDLLIDTVCVCKLHTQHTKAVLTSFFDKLEWVKSYILSGFVALQFISLIQSGAEIITYA